MMRDYGFNKSREAESATSFILRERDRNAKDAELLPMAWKRSNMGRSPTALLKGRSGIIVLLPALYALQERDAYRVNADAFLKFSIGTSDAYQPAPGDLSDDLLLALASRNHGLVERFAHTVVQNTEVREFDLAYPPHYAVKVLSGLLLGLPSDAQSAIDAFYTACAGRKFEKSESLLYRPWCDAAQAVIAKNSAAIQSAVREIAAVQRSYIEKELSGWRRGKLNVELSAMHFLNVELTSLLLVAHGAGLDVYEEDDPDFAFCDWKWLQSVWA